MLTSLNTTSAQISGTFSGTLYNQVSATDSVVVTNGKFDMLYSTQ